MLKIKQGYQQRPITWAGGYLDLRMGLVTRRVWAGPFMYAPEKVPKVKLAPEVQGAADLYLPIRDFSIPASKPEVDRVLWEVLNLLARNKPVYVGCRGGLGRTGLFLSLLAKATGVKDAAAFVRAGYCDDAVETHFQERYVSGYPIVFPAWRMQALYMKALFHGWS